MEGNVHFSGDEELSRQKRSPAESTDQPPLSFFAIVTKHRITSETQQMDDSISNNWLVLLFGQFIALAAVANSAAAYTLENQFLVVVPIFMLFLMYMLIMMLHAWQMIQDTRKKPYRLPFTNLQLSAPFWVYAAIGFLDVEGNYLTMMSLRYTSLTSATLLNSISVPATMFFSRLLLARKFRIPHVVGASMCVLGGTMTVWTDMGLDSPVASSHPHSFFGDLLAVMGAIIYGVGDAAGELFVKHVDRVEYLFCLGLFGGMITSIQSPILERKELGQLLMEFPSPDQWRIACTVLWFLVSVIAYYIASTLFYIRGDATLLNLSLRTTNLWAILFTIVVENEYPTTGFYGALLLTLGGILIYETCGKYSLRLEVKKDEAKVKDPANRRGMDDVVISERQHLLSTDA